MEYPHFRFKTLNMSQLYEVFVEDTLLGQVRSFRDQYLRRTCWQAIRLDGTFAHRDVYSRQRACEILYEDSAKQV